VQVDEVLTHRFAAVGGTPPYQWSVQGGDARFVLEPQSGQYSGSASEPLTVALSVFVTDAEGESASASAMLVVASDCPLEDCHRVLCLLRWSIKCSPRLSKLKAVCSPTSGP